MQSMDRPGVDPRWLPAWKSHRKTNLQGIRDYSSEVTKQLEHYARFGTPLERPDQTFADLEPPVRMWESTYIQLSINGRANLKLLEFELKGIDEGVFDPIIAMHAFAAAYTNEMIVMHEGSLRPARFKGTVPADLHSSEIPHTALGVVIGCKQHAFKLATMQLAALRNGDYCDIAPFPIHRFLLEILGEYLDVPRATRSSKDARAPILDELLKRWRSGDPAPLVDACLAACDLHTWHCNDDFEFNNAYWTRIPIEVLLVFKLRELIGLENPHIEHPLMNTSLGVLPKPVDFAPDELMQRARVRMQQDGYDEDGIYARVTGNSRAA
jgi:hypothetical protein